MRKIIIAFAGLVLAAGACLLGHSQTAPDSAQSSKQLEAVLNRMDQTAAKFRSSQADFVWDQYEKVVDDHDNQKGTIYFRQQSKGIEMAANIIEPAKKYVLFTDSKAQVYEPKIDRVTVYNTGKNKSDFESLVVLGFGGRGHDLLKSFKVNYLGTEDAQGMKADKLDLVPKSDKLRNNLADHIVLWIDPARGISVQQQFFEISGNYRLAKYSNIQMNPRIPDDVFKLKTTGNTTVVSPQG